MAYEIIMKRTKNDGHDNFNGIFRPFSCFSGHKVYDAMNNIPVHFHGVETMKMLFKPSKCCDDTAFNSCNFVLFSSFLLIEVVHEH